MDDVADSKATDVVPDASKPDKEQFCSGFARNHSKNIHVSEDGLTATFKLDRELEHDTERLYFGCVCGDSPLDNSTGYAFFEVEVLLQRHGFEDGIAIGVTTQDSLPQSDTDVPETIDCLEHVWCVGFNGLSFTSDGFKWNELDWDPAKLEVGDCVGCLVSPNGQMTIYVNCEIVASGPSNVPIGKPLYAVVDLLGATGSVKMLPRPTWFMISDNTKSLDTNALLSGSADEELSDIDAFELHDLVIDELIDGRIGLRLDKSTLTVTAIIEPAARSAWCVGDQIHAVQQQRVNCYNDWLVMLGEHHIDPQIVITVRRSKVVASHVAERTTAGLLGGVVGGALFGLGGVALIGGGWIAVSAATVPVCFGGLSGSAVGAGRRNSKTAFCSGAVAGFAGPTVTSMFLGGEFAVQACTDSEVDV